MANYRSSGEENLRADAHVYASGGNGTPGARGTDAGGDKVSHRVKSSAGKSGSYSATKKPSGVQSFSDENV